jgi:hypothetical protein
METIEERRDLIVLEWNFKQVITEKLEQLLEQQKIYWRQRIKIRWVKEGDGRTKLFHVTATIKHRNNLIAKLQKQNGEVVHNHMDKAAVLWEAFKERLGQSEFEAIIFNLSSLLDSNTELGYLEEPFTRAEIDALVKNLPNDKAPGPDRFNNEFIKNCWNLIKEDFYELCFAFQNNSVCLQSINDSFITLVPKVMVHREWGNTGQSPCLTVLLNFSQSF